MTMIGDTTDNEGIIQQSPASFGGGKSQYHASPDMSGYQASYEKDPKADISDEILKIPKANTNQIFNIIKPEVIQAANQSLSVNEDAEALKTYLCDLIDDQPHIAVGFKRKFDRIIRARDEYKAAWDQF